MEDNTVQPVEETTSQKPVEETTEPTVAELQEKLAKAEQTNSQLYARLKKQEGMPKEEKEHMQHNAETTNTPDNLDVIEFFAQGNTREDLSQLEVIMKGQGISMSEARESALFKAYKSQKDAEKKSEEAQLGGSNGMTPKPHSDYNINMTDEEHEAAWKKRRGIA